MVELSRLIQHPEEMSKETLYDLRELLALHPYYQTARLLLLQNLYILHDTSFNEELRQAAIYITDRKVIFQMVEAAHYQLKKEGDRAGSSSAPGKMASLANGKGHADRTSDLIDHFLETIPADGEEEAKGREKRKPTPADAAVDYVAYLMETETEQKAEEPSRTISLIDEFIGDGGFKLPKVDEAADYTPEYTPEMNESDNDDSDDGKSTEASGGVFTETLARIYIKQGKYERALQIIQRLHKQHPSKSAYYVDQMRFLEKLIANSKK